jgi:hypothetical protein
MAEPRLAGKMVDVRPALDPDHLIAGTGVGRSVASDQTGILYRWQN